MSDKLKRTVRTVLQVVIGVATAVPTLLAHAPASAALAQVVAVSGVVTHYFALIEAVPGFPEWLKLSTSSAGSTH